MKNIHLHYLKTDFRGEISHLTRQFFLKFLIFFWSVINKLKCSLMGIKVLKNTRFIGKTNFCRHRGSSITIGEFCFFNSDRYCQYNLIGINRNCILSTLTSDAKISIGSGSGFSGTVIGSFKSITIGKNVKCGANTLITDSDWHLSDFRSGIPAAVVIGDNVWLGEGVKVMKGVVIGENSIIGAGSVVTKDIPSNVIAAGNPCKVIRSLNSE